MSSRELDTEVAERVMSLKLIEGMVPVECPDRLPACEVLHRAPVLHYSTDIAAAMQVVEKMREKRYHVGIGSSAEGWETVFLAKGMTPRRADAPTLAESICRAALDAIGPKVKEGENG